MGQCEKGQVVPAFFIRYYRREDLSLENPEYFMLNGKPDYFMLLPKEYISNILYAINKPLISLIKNPFWQFTN